MRADAPFACRRTNADLVVEMVRVVEAAGGSPAFVAEVRAELMGRD